MAQQIRDYLEFVLDEKGVPKKKIIETLFVDLSENQDGKQASPLTQILTLSERHISTIECVNPNKSFHFSYDILVYRREIRDSSNTILELSSIQDSFFVRPVPRLNSGIDTFEAVLEGRIYIPTIYLGMAIKYDETLDEMKFSFSGAVEDKLVNPQTLQEEYTMLLFHENQITDGILIDISTNKVVTLIDCQLSPKI